MLGKAQVDAALSCRVIYASPFNDLSSLLHQGYSGTTPTGELEASSVALVWPFLLAGLLDWIVVLLATTLVLPRRVPARQIEEGLQI